MQVTYSLTILRDDLTGENGQTLGKKLLQIRTVLDGCPGTMCLQVCTNTRPACFYRCRNVGGLGKDNRIGSLTTTLISVP